jgi:hypothetical protein
MTESVDYEKLAGVLNRASADGKAKFCQMLWGNQPDAVQSKLMDLLSPEAQALVANDDDALE